jgi:hypothetical protein
MSPSKGLYVRKTAHVRKTRTNIHALIRTRAHDLTFHAIKAYASDRAATGTGYYEAHLTYLARANNENGIKYSGFIKGGFF